MSLFWIAYRSILQRGLASALTMVSMALGVGLVVVVLTVYGVVSKSFKNDKGLGYNMIVGAKGGREQLVLNMVYHLGSPVENVAYPYYLEFLMQPERDAELKNSYAFHANEARRMTGEAEAALLGGPAAAWFAAADAAAVKHTLRPLELGRNGKFGPMCDFAIPVCLGDYYERFRVVGTTPDHFSKLVFDEETNRKFEFAQGRAIEHHSKEHGYFEAVVGARVAKEAKVRFDKNGKRTNDPRFPGRPLQLGDEISPRHGAEDGHEHARKFVVVGILKPTGSAHDVAVFVNMEGFYLMEDHAKPIEEEPIAGTAPLPSEDGEDESEREPISIELIDRPDPLPYENREITGLLVRTKSPLFAPGLQKGVNKGAYAQAVFPIAIIYGIFEVFVDPIQQGFLFLTFAICLVSAMGILVSIYNSMNERRHEIAVMRALGADRVAVLLIILVESILLSLGGGVLGWFGGHLTVWSLGGFLERQTNVSVGLFSWEPTFAPLTYFFGLENAEWLQMPIELAIIPGLIVLAVFAGIVPAIQGYRTDVAQSLGK